MKTQNILEITTIPTASGVLVSANNNNKSLLMNNKNSCFYSCGNDTFVDFKKTCKEYDIHLESVFNFGSDPNLFSAYAKNTGIFSSQYDTILNNILSRKRGLNVLGDQPSLEGDLDKSLSETNIKYKKLLLSMCLKKICKGEIKIRAGMNDYFLRDKNYGLRGGWYKEELREYYGNGMSTNVINIPFGTKDMKGIQIGYNNDNLCCYAGLYNPANKSTQTFENTSNGFMTNQNQNLCDLGVTIKSSLCKDAKHNIHIQRYQDTRPSSENMLDIKRQVILNCDSTVRASLALLNAILKPSETETNATDKDTLYSVTLSNSGKIKDIEVSSCNTLMKGKNGNISMWSLGCVSKCKEIKCIPKTFGLPLAYGINVSTPLYLSRSSTKLDNDGIPFNFEVNCLNKICGFNIPIFFNLSHAPKELQLNNNITTLLKTDTGSSCIFGVRPYSIIDVLNKEVNTRYRVNCNVEGGLEE